MGTRASGTFDVKINPQPHDDKGGDPTVGRMSLEKTFQGDLEGASKGQMLTGGTGTEGSRSSAWQERCLVDAAPSRCITPAS